MHTLINRKTPISPGTEAHERQEIEKPRALDHSKPPQKIILASTYRESPASRMPVSVPHARPPVAARGSSTPMASPPGPMARWASWGRS